jgi:hypothetical protein
MHSRYLLVLTATIRPAANAAVQRRDPILRLEDYLTALRFWLNFDDKRLSNILFLENSGADLTPVRNLVQESNPHSKRVEILSVPGNDIPPGINYGYGEMEMLDQGLEKTLLRKSTTHMIKVTGRLRFPALGEVLDRLPPRFDVAVECRQRGKYATVLERLLKLEDRFDLGLIWKTARETLTAPEKPWTSAQVMMFSYDFYDQHLRKAYHEMRVPYPTLIENLICDRIIPFKQQTGVILRWPVNLEPEGFAGHAKKNYSSPKRTLIRQTRGLLRKLAPNVWF